MFDDQPYVQLLHDDLILVIILNKLADDTTPTAEEDTEGTVAFTPAASPHTGTSTSVVSMDIEGEQMQVDYEKVRNPKAVDVEQHRAVAKSRSPMKASRSTVMRPAACAACRKKKKRCPHRENTARSAKAADKIATRTPTFPHKSH